MAIVMVCYAVKEVDGQVVISNSQGESVTSNSPSELLMFLGKNYGTAINKKMFWNLDAAIAPVLKRVGIKVCTELVKEPECEAYWSYENGEVIIQDIKERQLELPENFFSMFYFRQSTLCLQVYGYRKSYFYNLNQFFETDEEISDPKEILKKADELTSAFFSMGLNPMKMSSPIAVFQSNVLEHIDFPTLADLPNSINEEDSDMLAEWSEQIMHREWTTALAVGTWHKGETFTYDLQGAYNFLFGQVYNFRYATFWHSQVPVKEAEFGVLKGRITINSDVKCSPICYKKGNGQTINPTGSSWDDLITLPEVRFMYRRGIGTFEMEDGIFWKQDAPIQPFKASMEKIFAQREKGGLVKKLAKRIGASTWAKCIQKPSNGGINKFYSPLLALQTKTNCRLMVADFIYDHKLQDAVLHIGTDGLIVNQQVSIPDVVKLGAWKSSPNDDCIIVSSGRVFTPTNKPSGLYYEDVVRMINENPKESYYATKKKRHLTLGEAVAQDELENVGELREFQTSLDLVAARAEQDMEFLDFPSNGGELLVNKYYGQAVGVN